MNVLVTGANGYLGKHVVAALQRTGHSVRSLSRPRMDPSLFMGNDIVLTDLSKGHDLTQILHGIDVVVHLAAAVTGDEAAHQRDTIDATRNLLNGMDKAGVRKLVLCSSMSVYDWSKIDDRLTELSPTETSESVVGRDAYAAGKVAQEALVFDAAKQHKLNAVVLRPGTIWGDGRFPTATACQNAGPLRLVIGPSTRLRLTHVENCADAFVKAVESTSAGMKTINVVDDDRPTAWDYVGTIGKGVRFPLAYRLLRGVAVAFSAIVPRSKLPGLLRVRQVDARFKPVTCSNDALKSLGWTQRVAFADGFKQRQWQAQKQQQPQTNAGGATKPMRLAYLTSAYARAADSFIRGEVAELRAAGHTVVTFSVNRSNAKEAVSDDIRKEQESTEYLLSGNLSGLIGATLITKLISPLKYLSAFVLAQKCSPPGTRNRLWHVAYLMEACFLARRLKAHRIGHLHNHLGRGSATVAMLASKLSGVPYSLTIHGPTEFDEPKALALGTKIEHAAFAVGVSQFGRSQLCRWSDAKYWDKIHVVHCGLDRPFLDHAVTPVPPEPRFVCVARLAEQKGLTILLQAAAKLHKDGIRFELTIVGDGPLRPEIEKMIDRDGLLGYVRLAGWQNAVQIREHLLRSRAFVMPSFAEGLPVVLMESLALNRPVISTQIAGIPELVRNGESGWLIPPGSVDALATAMKRAIDASADEVTTMAKNGRERVRQAFDRAAEVQKLVRLFETSVSRRNPGVSQ